MNAIPCPYKRGDDACRAGMVGHKGPHDFPPPTRCDYYLHSLGVPPRKCSLAYGHESRHEYAA